jgi:hypothetical protein
MGSQKILERSFAPGCPSFTSAHGSWLIPQHYGILSEDFYNALMSGRLERYDEYDETRADFSRWKGIYEIVETLLDPTHLSCSVQVTIGDES